MCRSASAIGMVVRVNCPDRQRIRPPTHSPETALLRRQAQGRRPGLPAWPPDIRSADHDGRGAAMIANGNVLVVWQQRIVGAEQPANPGGVMDGGVKVGIVADLCRKLHCYIAHGDEKRFDALLHLRVGLICIEERAKMMAQRRPRCRAKRHQTIENGCVASSDYLLEKRCKQTLAWRRREDRGSGRRWRRLCLFSADSERRRRAGSGWGSPKQDHWQRQPNLLRAIPMPPGRALAR